MSIGRYRFNPHAMKAYGEMNVQLHAFLASALDGFEWPSSRFCLFISVKELLVPTGVGGWVDPSVGLDLLAKREILAPAGNRTSIVQTVARHYTD
jgi:hypothetical protein